MKTVLAPIDFSRVSERVIAEAIALARAIGARLVLLHVVAPAPAVGKAPTLIAASEEVATAADREAAKKLTKLQRSLRDEGVTAHAVHVGGDTQKCIIAQAERLSADYVVMGSRGRTAFSALLMGSTASGVLKHASCRVMIVPPVAKDGRKAKISAREPAEVAKV
jgi:nucleotide-binding universal stress UspA family protein